MVAGAFGGVYGREHLCVQSMDGFVTLVEQDRLVGMRQLSKFLLPGPLAYCTKQNCGPHRFDAERIGSTLRFPRK